MYSDSNLSKSKSSLKYKTSDKNHRLHPKAEFEFPPFDRNDYHNTIVQENVSFKKKLSKTLLANYVFYN